MYMGGLGAYQRLWIYEPPGSPNCPANLTSGCYNTGQSPGCGDPRQFASMEALTEYADQRGEQKRQASSAEEAMKICQPSQIPNQPPIQSQFDAPGYQEPTRSTRGGARILPTGVATQSSPQIITLPGTQTTVIVPAEDPALAAIHGAVTDWMPLVIGGGLLAFFLSRKKGGR